MLQPGTDPATIIANINLLVSRGYAAPVADRIARNYAEQQQRAVDADTERLIAQGYARPVAETIARKQRDAQNVTEGRLLSGQGAPDPSTGTEHDFYIDTDRMELYGPKTGNAWGVAVSLIGPQGAGGGTGAIGPAGPQGPQGEPGPQGPAGADGADGAAGATGPEGPQGATGPAGPTGPAGADGATGPQGPQGPQGIQGPAGPTGPTGPAGTDSWAGIVSCCYGDGNPTTLEILNGFSSSVTTVAGPTGAGIGTSVGRLMSFNLKYDIRLGRVFVFGLATVTNVYTLAIYNRENNPATRVLNIDPMNIVAGWNYFSPGDITLTAGRYWLGLGAKSAGTVAGLRTPDSPIANSLGLASIVSPDLGRWITRYLQVTLTAGAWPTTLPATSAAVFASNGATGTLPLVFLEAGLF